MFLKTNACEICAKQNIKIHRRYEGKGYCHSCYKLLFTKKPCTLCQTLNYFHGDDKDCICLTCRRKQPCIRCGKDAFENGSNTQYGRVCQPCGNNYFKAKKICSECGELKPLVTTYKNIGIYAPMCQGCYSRQVNATCPCCLRNRKLIDTPTGKMCQKCHDLGQIPCPQCTKPMWGGVGKRCHDCYWSDKLSHDMSLNQQIFHHSVIQQGYEAFVTWYADKMTAAIASMKQNNYIDFFVRCDKLWGKIPDYDKLVVEFKPNGLRQFTNVLRWLIATQQITVNEVLKEQMAEEERIIRLFEKLDNPLPKIVADYHQFLIARQIERNTALKTIRLALQPVVAILPPV